MMEKCLGLLCVLRVTWKVGGLLTINDSPPPAGREDVQLTYFKAGTEEKNKKRTQLGARLRGLRAKLTFTNILYFSGENFRMTECDGTEGPPVWPPTGGRWAVSSPGPSLSGRQVEAEGG